MIYTYLQPVDTMEHVPIEQLGERLDELMTRCDKYDIGFVIDDKEKQYVLCPARWFDCCHDPDFGNIVISAVRYAMRRETYMPDVTVRFVKSYIRLLDIHCLDIICRDIYKVYIEESATEDSQMWKSLYWDCKHELERKLKVHESNP